MFLQRPAHKLCIAIRFPLLGFILRWENGESCDNSTLNLGRDFDQAVFCVDFVFCTGFVSTGRVGRIRFTTFSPALVIAATVTAFCLLGFPVVLNTSVFPWKQAKATKGTGRASSKSFPEESETSAQQVKELVPLCGVAGGCPGLVVSLALRIFLSVCFRDRVFGSYYTVLAILKLTM